MTDKTVIYYEIKSIFIFTVYYTAYRIYKAFRKICVCMF